MSKVWLITGASRGLGRAILEAALLDGGKVLATARDTSKLAGLQTSHGERLATFELDVTHEEQAKRAVSEAARRFGRLDVLVNNAGYGHIQPFESTPSGDFRAQLETNLFGVVNLTRAAIPVMRAQGGGHVFQVSSIGGRISSPGLAAYQAAKWAVGGFSDVVGKEVAPFGIRVCTLEPGGMRTEWGREARSTLQDLPEDYRPSMAQFKALVEAYVGHEVGDPERIAKLIVMLASRETVPARLMLGSDAWQVFEAEELARRESQQKWKAVTLATDFGAAAPEWPSQ
ncbi:Oxidoreductase [Paraburkholderia unamae]|uniref:SDR family NAD(P)-dependent oxidoreductase n=1 Tax=Paraburkholderia unamae TaxID=219649 RepID=UPI000DC5108F|nr:SDR family NAD(P)-dependent oxidoreductase [Paraburkholderia unamae]RAR62531.1 NADP-dependent 3-hydroxy acid dehydrogenase YdfG [Paraburkholderia unamae]CAG9265373.1 Oxidoreductase [Paraburkholderia unamae]